MAKKQTKAADFSADELLAELRMRESGENRKSGRRSLKQRSLANMDSKALIKELRAQQKVIYGTDDRIEVHEIADSDAKENAEAVAGIFDISDLTDNGDGTTTIRTVKFGDAQRLCSGEVFREQPTAPNCTAFLVGKDLMATAGHCINGTTIGRRRFIFGFRMKPDGTFDNRVSNDEIYMGISIVKHKLEGKEDYALIKLDRPVEGKPILPVRRIGKVPDNSKLYVIGHPSGLPAKFADDAAIRDNSPTPFFVANLDTYGGNSGSPVFNDSSHEVEGILVRGETDFVFSGSCRVSNVCPTSGCRGEDVTRITEISNDIPESGEVSEGDNEDLADRVDKIEDTVDEILQIVKRLEEN